MLSNPLLKNQFGEVKPSTFSDQLSKTQAEGITIEHSLFRAEISLYGGHVLTWQPVNEKPVFWMSKSSLFGEGKAIRGGIPLCFPWFGEFNVNNFKHTKTIELSEQEKSLISNHGFARTSQWEIESVDITAEFVRITLIQSGENANPAWAIPYQLKQEIILGRYFTQTLSITNKSVEPIEFTGALHSYFSVSSPQSVTIDQLSAVAFDDKLTSAKQQRCDLPHCLGPLDRIYYTNDTMTFVDSGWNRKLTIEQTGCNQWVLWNPGKETAEKMTDVHQGGENEYICLEAANTHPIEIKANSTKSMSQTIKLSAL